MLAALLNWLKGWAVNTYHTNNAQAAYKTEDLEE